MKRPNILFILTDQQRKDTLSTYGDLLSRTPSLDQLASVSTVFDNAYCTCPICTPARGSIQTGLYPMHHGMLTNSYNYGTMVQELPDTPELLSYRLAEAGYQSAYTGKWHIGSGAENVKNDAYIQKYMGDVEFAELKLNDDALPTTRGYIGDDFPGHGFGGHIYPAFKAHLKEQGLSYDVENIIEGFYGGHRGGEITSGLASTVEHFLIERSKALIDELEQKEDPWYLQLNFWGPHEPYFAPTEFLDHYRDLEIPEWHNLHGDSPNKPKIHELKRGRTDKWEDVLPYVRHYFACVEHTDYQIGQLLDYLKERGLYDDTIIFFSADHGESLGIHEGLCDKAIFMYEETCSIPLFVKMPKQKEAQRIGKFATSCDIYSTILDYAGAAEDKLARDGKSFKPLIEGEDVPWPDTAVTECSGIGAVLFSQRMLRKGQMKYIFNSGDVDELYDLSSDPYEQINQIDNPAYGSELQMMRESLLSWMEAHNDNLIFEYKALRMRDLI